jgi:hypothetical protein
MEDKQVGELWRKAIAEHPLGVADWQLWMQALIRKLVEERAKHRGGVTKALSYQLALSDFGIDPETWK